VQPVAWMMAIGLECECRVSVPGLFAVVAVALGVHLFVVFYEEPTLRGKFGADYEEYCRKVDRWWPRVRGWDKPQ